MTVRGSDSGQATLELALLLPLVAVLAGCLVEIGGLATDRVRLWHAAREAARVGAVDSNADAIREAAEAVGLNPLQVSVEPGAEGRLHGEPLRVDVSYRPTTKVPLIGSLIGRGVITASATMRIEQP